MSKQISLVIVASTGGAVMNQLLHNSFFKSRVHSVISDRECGAVAKARIHRVRTQVIPEKDRERISQLVLAYLREHRADYAISFFSKLFVGELLSVYRDRIVNLHPSLLPSFKGLHGFDDAIAGGVKFVGSTIHFIDENMDEGKIIQQTIAAVDETNPLVTRHRIFEQQCRSLLQVVKWLEDDRIVVEGKRVRVKGAAFGDAEFSPNLDFDQAISLDIPKPEWL
ncbi:MAG: formyltransferase family protein [Pyrinomonadaceae bacterium]